MIYLVEKFWQMPGGVKSWGYDAVGYITCEKQKQELSKAKIIGTGWPITRGHSMPEYKFTVLREVQIGKEEVT